MNRFVLTLLCLLGCHSAALEDTESHDGTSTRDGEAGDGSSSDADGSGQGAPDGASASDGDDGAAQDGAAGDGSPADGTSDSGPEPLPGPLVYAQSFEEFDPGDTWLSSCKWRKHAQVKAGCGVGDSQCLSVAHDPDRNEPPLFPLPPVDERPPYPAGSGGVCEPYYTNTATDVVQGLEELPGGDEYSLSYDLFFEDGYDWARGGKLPGLSAEEWDSGCSVEGDGIATDPGAARWSVRLMWRANGASELYVYDQDRAPGACGTRSPTEQPFVTGRWQAVTIYVRLNSAADASDGEARFYLDGALLRHEQNLRLRATTEDASRIKNIFFSTFFGGNEQKRLYCLDHPGERPYCATPDPYAETTWVPRDVATVRFDNLSVHEGLVVRQTPGQ